jgi:hypothetical protein
LNAVHYSCCFPPRPTKPSGINSAAREISLFSYREIRDIITRYGSCRSASRRANIYYTLHNIYVPRYTWFVQPFFYFIFCYLIRVLGPGARLINVGTLVQLYRRLERARRRFANHRSITTRVNNNELPAQRIREKSVSIYRIVRADIYTIHYIQGDHHSPTTLTPSHPLIINYNVVLGPGFFFAKNTTEHVHI